MSGRNVEIVLAALVDAIRTRDPEQVLGLLSPDVVWQGLTPELRCDGRRQAMRIIRHRFEAAPLVVDAIEAVGAGDSVVVGLRGPGFNGIPGDIETVGQVYNVFTFEDGLVVQWRDFLNRRAALEAAGVADLDWA